MARALRLCIALIASLLAGSLAAQDSGRTPDLLAFIRAIEAPGGYDDYERRIRLPPPEPLTAMTIREVLDWQRRVGRTGAVSTAAGGYQIIRPTLMRLVRQYDIDPRARFDAPMQDRLARLLIAECGPKGPPSRHPRYGNCLARIWAALPLTTGPGRGRSAYHGVAGNRALATPETILALLAGDSVATPPAAEAPAPRTLAFGAARVTVTTRRAEINNALQKARGSGGLTPSVRVWKTDPYAQE